MAIHRINSDTLGVYAIYPTPFTDEGEIDFRSVDSLVEFYVQHDVDGLTIMGILGEAEKISTTESAELMTRVLERVAARMPIVVGVSNPGTTNLVRLAKQAMGLGAAGVMLAPLSGLRTDDQIYSYCANVIEQLGPEIPICYQDYPQSTGVFTSIPVFNRLVAAFDTLVMLKHEESPGLRKISDLRAAEKAGQRRASILVGNGGLHLPQELRRGADGAMTGFAYPEMLVNVCRKFFSGEVQEAEDLFDLYLPLLRHEQQRGIGLAIRKEILRRRGVIASAALRSPAAVLRTADHVELDQLMARLTLKLAG